MRTRLALGCSVFLAGCDHCPPPDPVGGTPAARDEVRSAVHDFYAALGPIRICVTRIDLRESEDRDGHYARAWQGIGVDAGTPLGPGRVATHELCHALDHQHGVRWQQDNLWRYDPPRTDLDATRFMGEAFADTCEVGPLSLQLVGEACPGDLQGSRAYAVLQRWFPVPDPRIGVTEWTFEELGSWTTHMPILDLEATGMEGGRVRFDYESDEGSHSAVFEIDTGLPATLGLPATEPVLALPTGWFQGPAAGTADQAIAIAAIRATNGGIARRLLAVDGTGVQSLGCLAELEVPFASDGRLYTAWAEDAELHWGVWTWDPAGGPPGRPLAGNGRLR